MGGKVDQPSQPSRLSPRCSSDSPWEWEVGSWKLRPSVRNDDLPGQDRSRAGQQAEAGEIADPGEDGYEDRQLDGVGRARVRQDFPEQPQRRLREAYRPHRAVEKAPLVAFALG